MGIFTRQTIWVFLILLLGLGLRLFYLSEAIYQPDFSAPMHDAEFKDYWAHAILSGDYTPPRNEGNPFMEGYPLPNPPGYPFFLALIYWFDSGNYLAVRWVQIVLGVLNIYLVFLLTKKLFNYKAGLFAGLGIATYWAFVYYDLELNQVTIYITLNLLFFLLLFKSYTEKRWGILALAGLIYGITSFFRGEAFVVTFPLSLFIIYLFYRRERARDAIKAGIIFLIFAIIPTLPLIIYNYRLSGTLTPVSHTGEASLSIAFDPNTPEDAPHTPEMLRWLNKTPEDTVEIFDMDGMTKGLGKELGLGRRASYKEWRDYLTSGALRNIREYPWICVKKCVRRFLWTFSPIELDENKVIHYEIESSRILSYLPRFPLPWSLFALGLLLFAMPCFVKRGKDVNILPTTGKFLVVLLLFIMTHIGIFSLLIAGSRYRIPLIPYFFIFGGYAFSTFLEKVKQRNLKQSLILLTTFVIIFSLAHISFFPYQPNRARWLDERRRGYQQTGMLLPGIKFFQQQLERYPDDDNVYYHLGLLMYDLAMKETKNDIKLKNEQDYWNKAEELFKKCLSLNPEHRSAPYNLGLVFAQKNDWENALKYFEQAVQRNPQKPDMQFALAWAYEKLGNMDKALDNYRQVLTKDPNHVRALTHSGAILYRLGKISEAKRYIEKAVEIDPNYPDAQFNLGQVLLAVRNPSTAIKHFEFIQGKYKPEHELLKSIGLCYVQMLDYKKALQYLTEAKHQNPEQWEQEPILAVCYAGLGMKEACIRSIEETKKQSLDSIQLFNLGHAWELLGEWDNAEQYYKDSLEKDKRNADAWAGLGNIYLAKGDKNTAYKYFEQALEMDPHQIGAWFNKILQFVQNQNWDKAKQELNEFLTYYPEYTEAYYNLGIVYEQWGDRENAKNEYEKTLKKNPDHIGALFSRATIALSEADFDTAQNLFARLMPYEPFKASYHLGIVYSLKEDWQKAHEFIIKAFLLNPEPFFRDNIYAFNIARSYEHLNCLDEAEYFYRLSLSLNPDFVDTKDALSYVLLKKGNVFEAYLLLNSIFNYQIPTGWSFYHYSLVWEQMGEPILALSFAEQANEVLPEQSPILHQLGGLYRKLGNHSKAEEFLLQAQKLDPQNPIITKTLAFLRSDQERFAEAKNLFITCTQALPTDPEIYEGLADIYMKTGELKQAEQNYRKSLEIKEIPTVVNKLGLLLADLNRVEESIPLLEKAILYFPNDSITITRLADLKVIIHIDQQARELYERALTVDSQNYLTHRNYADLLVRAGEYELAEKHYKFALQLRPKDPIALAGLGLLYARNKDYKSAKEILLPLAQVKTDLLPVNQQLAQIFMEENQPEKAIKYIKRCILAQPDRKEFRELLQKTTGSR